MSGWIKLHRKMLEWEWYDDQNTFRVFMTLLMLANHSNKKWKGIDVPAGSLITGRVSLAKKTGLTQQNVRTSINHLKSTGEITSKTYPKFSVISIANWQNYQQSDEQLTSTLTSNQPATNQQVTTPKECKKERSIEKPKKTKPKGVRVSEDYQPNEKHKQIAIDLGVDLKNERIKFIDHHLAKASLMTDWDAAFRNWLRNAVKYGNAIVTQPTEYKGPRI